LFVKRNCKVLGAKQSERKKYGIETDIGHWQKQIECVSGIFVVAFATVMENCECCIEK
jgi:hypothetical protein